MAQVATGLEPGRPQAIPDSAFQAVSVPSPLAAPTAAPTPGRTADIRPVVDPQFETAPPDRAQPALQAAKPVVVPIPTPTPKPQPAAKSGSSGGGSSGGGGSDGGGSSGGTSHSISGLASYYCRAGVSPCTYGYPDSGGFDAYAAAGPRLRDALGDWRGRIVYVDGIRVKLIDWCQCYKGESYEKLLDLYYDVYSRTGTNVTIRW